MKYWFKVVKTDNIIIKTVYEQSLSDCNSGKRNWVSNVKKLLNDHGFSYIFDNVANIDCNIILSEFKGRLLDTFKQDWFGTLSNSPVLTIYKEVKTSFGYEHYLDILPRKLRLFFTRLRLSVHPLRIQTGRYARNRIPREERYCLVCNGTDIEDEYHFICICPRYADLRKKYLKRCYYMHPSVNTILQLLK